MSSYAEIASKIPLPVSRVHKARDSMESLGQIRQSPPRRDHFKSLSPMEDSELISSEPTPRFDSLLEELGMGTLYLSEDASETAAIFSDDEAAAILNGDKTWDLHGTKNQGTKRLPSNSPVVIDHDDAGNEIIELPGDLGDSTSNELPRRKPRDSKNSPDPTNGEWEVINRRNRILIEANYIPRFRNTETTQTLEYRAAIAFMQQNILPVPNSRILKRILFRARNIEGLTRQLRTQTNEFSQWPITPQRPRQPQQPSWYPIPHTAPSA